MDKELDPVGSIAAAFTDLAKRSMQFLYLVFSGILIGSLSIYFSRTQNVEVITEEISDDVLIPSILGSISTQTIFLILIGALLSIFSLIKILRDQENNFLLLCGITGLSLLTVAAYKQLQFDISQITIIYLSVGIALSFFFLKLNRKIQLAAWQKELEEIHQENEVRRKKQEDDQKEE